MQQLLISNAYPGILDGVLGDIGYSDERSVTVSGHDCRFITESVSASDLDWTEEQGRAVTGFARYSHSGAFGTSTCTGYMLFDGVDYPQSCPGHIPPADRYDPATNPDGIRCAMADFVSNVYGVDEQTGFGRRIIPDTVGVQYGLTALQDEVISPEQFVDLNERVGGLNSEGERTRSATRSTGRRSRPPTRPAGSTSSTAACSGRRSSRLAAIPIRSPTSTTTRGRGPCGNGCSTPMVMPATT